MNETNRREFLTATTALAGTALFQGGAFAGGNDVIKIGLIGCGGRGTGAAADCLAADPNLKLVAMGDAFEGRLKGSLEHLKRQAGTAAKVDVSPEKQFVGLDAYKKVIDSGVDLVVLATPPGFRPQHLEAAVNAGKHVFTEKPVAVDGTGIRKVLEVYKKAKEKNLAIVAGTQRRHQKGYLETMKQLHDGAIGEIVAGRCYWNQGNIWFRGREKGMSDVAYQIHNWYHFVWLCGDHIVEQHVHNLDVINWALNAHPIKATGMGGRSNRAIGEAQTVGQIFDHFSVELEYPNGVVVESKCRQIDGCANNISEAVVGTKGRCQVNAYNINGKQVGSDEGAKGPYQQEHVDLIKSIRDGKPLNELEQVAFSTLTAIMGRVSTYTGKTITWEQALNSKEDTFPKDLTFDSALLTTPVAVPGRTKI